jgi:hypothetical protein
MAHDRDKSGHSGTILGAVNRPDMDLKKVRESADTWIALSRLPVEVVDYGDEETPVAIQQSWRKRHALDSQ